MNYKQIIVGLQAEKEALQEKFGAYIVNAQKDLRLQLQRNEELKAMSDRQTQENMRLVAENEALKESNKKLQVSIDKLKAAPMIEAAPIELYPSQKDNVKIDVSCVQRHAVAEKKKPAPRSTKKK